VSTFDISVGGLVRNASGQILLIRRSPASTWSPGLWELPGGKPDPGESASESLAREALEETGLTITPIAFIGTGDFEHPRTHVIVNYFEAEIIGKGTVRLSSEHSDFKWVDLPIENWDELTPPARQVLSSLNS